jgi:hypothetical protein
MADKLEVGSKVRIKNPNDPEEEFGVIVDGDADLDKWSVCFDDDFIGNFYRDQFEVLSVPKKEKKGKVRFNWVFS